MLLGLAAGEGGAAGLHPGLMDAAGRPDAVASALEHSQRQMMNHIQQPMVNHSQPMVTREPEGMQQMQMSIPQEDDGSKTTVLPCRARGKYSVEE